MIVAMEQDSALHARFLCERMFVASAGAVEPHQILRDDACAASPGNRASTGVAEMSALNETMGCLQAAWTASSPLTNASAPATDSSSRSWIYSVSRKRHIASVISFSKSTDDAIHSPRVRIRPGFCSGRSAIFFAVSLCLRHAT